MPTATNPLDHGSCRAVDGSAANADCRGLPLTTSPVTS